MADGKDLAPLTPAIIKALNDKMYEKRKNGALEVERLVKSLAKGNDRTKLLGLTGVLRTEFIFSTNPNSRKGGLIALAATAIALGQAEGGIKEYLKELVPPVLACFADNDSRVRYYACEAMYNISKVARTDILEFFNRIFDGLSKLAADPDPGVKNGAELLDRLIKDIVTENACFDVEAFIPLLSERIYAVNPHVRQFLVTWLTVLDSVPDFELLDFLPNFLNGLFKILSDPNEEIRRMCEAALSEFLTEIHEAKNVDFQAMVSILVAYCSSDDQLTKFMAITWINDFITLAKGLMLPFVADMLGAILPVLSYEVDTKLRELAISTNQNLMKLTHESDIATKESAQSNSFDLPIIIHVLNEQLRHTSVATRTSTLRWFLMLHLKMPGQIFEHIDEFAPSLLKALSDPADKVVLLALEVLAEISSTQSEDLKDQATAFFDRFTVDLMTIFSNDRNLLEARGPFIVRQLCVLLEAEKIYRAFAGILLKEDDLDFAQLMVQNLNIILLTSTELRGLRMLLKELKSARAKSLFCILYRSWSHDPVATLSLCLLTQVYDHACQLLLMIGELEVTVALLVELDKLIQLLESPIFTSLRLQLLEPQRYAYLIKCLYGILMLMPQSSAYNTLRARLDCVPTIIHSLQELEGSRRDKRQRGNIGVEINFEELLGHFDKIQNAHAVASAQSHRLGHGMPERQDGRPRSSAAPARK